MFYLFMWKLFSKIRDPFNFEKTGGLVLERPPPARNYSNQFPRQGLPLQRRGALQGLSPHPALPQRGENKVAGKGLYGITLIPSYPQ